MKQPAFRNSLSADLEGETIFYTPESVAASKLNALWNPSHRTGFLQLPRFRYQEESKLATQAPAFPAPKAEVPQQPEPEPSRTWLFGFGKSFSKAVDALDRKLQGRILEAMADLATAPVTNRGDTIKPLDGDMNGFWRYRIGDFRLVYYADEATHTITLYDFASRGSIYD
ncbi:MAG TPA: type II toxin-antitoxin system RelE/ParE family toxin [Candidatus Dormibacteraeota bacterium]|nr:type II toxin-antitoxin system RelE/ParE family toxin [Candidatus Dormibacteraeota bacterium]